MFADPSRAGEKTLPTAPPLRIRVEYAVRAAVEAHSRSTTPMKSSSVSEHLADQQVHEEAISFRTHHRSGSPLRELLWPSLTLLAALIAEIALSRIYAQSF